MPGPGGGSHGGGGRGGFGGGGRGGFSGGGRGGFGGGRGGYHGPHPHGFYRPYRPPFMFYGHHPYGGCCGGFFGLIVGSILLLLLALLLLLGSLGNAISDIRNGGSVVYNEEKFQDYANEQYQQIYGGNAGYEDNILLVFLTGEDQKSYSYIAWVGDDIVSNVNYLFGNEYTALGAAMSSSINTTSFKYALSGNLALMVDTMREKVSALHIDDPFKCNEAHATNVTRVYDHTDLALNQNTIRQSLAAFTDKTGIPISMVVATEADVFGKQIRVSSFVILFLAIALIAFAVYNIVGGMRNKKNGLFDRMHQTQQPL